MTRCGRTQVLFAFIVVCALSSSTSGTDTVTVLTAPRQPVPKTLFGLHIHRADTTTTWPKIPFGSWRLWDTYLAWPNLEPSNGKFDFHRLDKLLDLAEAHHVDVLLQLALSPPWASARPKERSGYEPGFAAEPRDMQDWRTYVRAVATHCKGRVHNYEVWNEPNLKMFYTGSIEEMVRLTNEAYKILKDVDPSNTVVSPSATLSSGLPWLEQFLEKGGGAYVDVIGYHLYVDPQSPEAMVPRIQAIRKLAQQYKVGNKPLWNTETGWLVANRATEVKPSGGFQRVLSEEESADFMARSFLLAWAAGVSRFYWYSWDHGSMGMTERDGKTVKSNAGAYAAIERWMVGSTFSACRELVGNTWVCSLDRPNSYKAQIVWNPTSNFSLPIVAGSGMKYAEDLKGKVTDLKGRSSIPIGTSPILVESQLLQ